MILVGMLHISWLLRWIYMISILTLRKGLIGLKHPSIYMIFHTLDRVWLRNHQTRASRVLHLRPPTKSLLPMILNSLILSNNQTLLLVECLEAMKQLIPFFYKHINT